MRRDFTPLMHTVNGMVGRDARASDKILATLLAEK